MRQAFATYTFRVRWLLCHDRFLSLSLSLSVSNMRGTQRGSKIFAASFLAWQFQRCSSERFVVTFLGMRPVDIHRAATSSSKTGHPMHGSIKAAIEPTRAYAIKRDSRRSSSDGARSLLAVANFLDATPRERASSSRCDSSESGRARDLLTHRDDTYGRSVVSFASRCTEAVVKRP